MIGCDTKRKTVSISLAAIMLVVALLLSACAPGPAEEARVVKIGYIAPLTGGPAPIMQLGWRNLMDYLSWFEKTRPSEITFPSDVKVELVWADSSFEAAKAISVYERMRDEIVFIHLPSPTEATALKPRLERDGIPAMTMSVSEDLMYPPTWIFAIYGTESERFAAVCDWIMANWKEERPPRIGMIGTDTPSGRAAEVMGTKYAQSLGIQMLPFEAVPYLPLDVTPQLLRLSNQGADFIYNTSTWVTVVPIMKDAERLGLIGKIRFGGGIEDTQSLELIDALGPLAEGYFHARYCPWYKEAPILWEILRQYRGKLDTSGGGATTLLYGPVPIEAIGRAIQKVGLENVDGQAVKEALYTIKDYDPHHIGRPVSYSPEDHRGAPKVRMYVVQNGDVIPIGDWVDAHMLIPER